VSPILASFLLLILTLIGGVLVYALVVEPYVSVIRSYSSGLVLKYVTDYNSTHAICYVLQGSVDGLVFNGTAWVLGIAYRGDLVVVPRELVWVYMR